MPDATPTIEIVRISEHYAVARFYLPGGGSEAEIVVHKDAAFPATTWKPATITWERNRTNSGVAQARLFAEVLLEAVAIAERWDADPATIPQEQ